MAKRKITKQSKRRLLLFGTVSVVLIVYFLISLSYYAINIYKLKKEEQVLTSDLEELKHDEKILKTEIEKLQDKDYLAKYARENYSYSKDGELVLKIEKEEKTEEKKETFSFDIRDNRVIIIGIFVFFSIIIHVLRKGKRKKS